MNKIYRVIWNQTLACFIAISELRKNKRAVFGSVSTALLTVGTLLTPVTVQAIDITENEYTTGFDNEFLSPYLYDSSAQDRIGSNREIISTGKGYTLDAQFSGVMESLVKDLLVEEESFFLVGYNNINLIPKFKYAGSGNAFSITAMNTLPYINGRNDNLITTSKDDIFIGPDGYEGTVIFYRKDGAPRRVSGIDGGNIRYDSTYAITGAQLSESYTRMVELAEVLGKGLMSQNEIDVGEAELNSKFRFKLFDVEYKTVTGALEAIDSKVGSIDKEIKNIDFYVRWDDSIPDYGVYRLGLGATQNDADTLLSFYADKKDENGVTNQVARRVTGIKNGTGDEDAVNIGQLNSLLKKLDPVGKVEDEKGQIALGFGKKGDQALSVYLEELQSDLDGVQTGLGGIKTYIHWEPAKQGSDALDYEGVYRLGLGAAQNDANTRISFYADKDENGVISQVARRVTGIANGTAQDDAVNIGQLDSLLKKLDSVGKVEDGQIALGFGKKGDQVLSVYLKELQSGLDGVQTGLEGIEHYIAWEPVDSSSTRGSHEGEYRLGLGAAQNDANTLLSFYADKKDENGVISQVARRVTGIASGTAQDDAVNIGQLDSLLKKLDSVGKVEDGQIALGFGKNGDQVLSVYLKELQSDFDGIQTDLEGIERYIVWEPVDSSSTRGSHEGVYRLGLGAAQNDANTRISFYVDKDENGVISQVARRVTGIANGTAQDDAVNIGQLDSLLKKLDSAGKVEDGQIALGFGKKGDQVLSDYLNELQSDFDGIQTDLEGIEHYIVWEPVDSSGTRGSHEGVYRLGVGAAQNDANTLLSFYADKKDENGVTNQVARRVTGIANGTGDDDAVNIGQLDSLLKRLDSAGKVEDGQIALGFGKKGDQVLSDYLNELQSDFDGIIQSGINSYVHWEPAKQGSDALAYDGVYRLGVGALKDDTNTLLSFYAYKDENGVISQAARRVTGIANGTGDEDAVNIGQLNSLLGRLDSEGKVEDEKGQIALGFGKNGDQVLSVYLKELQSDLDGIQTGLEDIEHYIAWEPVDSNSTRGSHEGEYRLGIGAAQNDANTRISFYANQLDSQGNTVQVSRRVTGIAKGFELADAVNIEQLNSLLGRLNPGSRVDQAGNINLGFGESNLTLKDYLDTLNSDGGGGSADGLTVRYDTHVWNEEHDSAHSITLGGVTKIEPVTRDNGGVDIWEPATPPILLTNLKDGDIDPLSTDAINGGQLFQFRLWVEDVLNNSNGGNGGNGGNGSSNSATVASNNTSSRPNASATGRNSVALGEGSEATGNNSVAVGSGSVADRDNTVSVGSDGHERQITNVARGEAETDAVNVGQLNESLHAVHQSGNDRFRHLNRKIGKLEDKLSAGVASAMAMGSVPQAYSVGGGMVSAGAASYNGESAIAIGVSRVSEDGKWVTKLQGSGNTDSDFGVAIGFGYQW